MGGASIGRLGRRLVALGLAVILGIGCAKPTQPTELLEAPQDRPNRLIGSLEEVSPPEGLQTLKGISDRYTPQVRVLSPRPGEVVEDTSVSVRFQVRGLPIYRDERWQLGPHLNVFLDDQPYRAVYDLSEPLQLTDLAPGTHTLRVFAARPWDESFKNQGAFDQRTFHVFARTPQKGLGASQPLLTYSSPQGSYGAEPILLDFYLTNAPLHLIAQEADSDLPDWRVRCTVNGQSFVFDQWQPIYLKGFKPGRNWVQLELIDPEGQPIASAFNNTVRIVDYQPGGEDTLSQLVRGELTAAQVARILDPSYVAPEPAVAEPEPPAQVEPEMAEPEPESAQVESEVLEDAVQGDADESAPMEPQDLESTPVEPEPPDSGVAPELEALDQEGPEVSEGESDLEAPEILDAAEPESLTPPEASEESEQSLVVEPEESELAEETADDAAAEPAAVPPEPEAATDATAAGAETQPEVAVPAEPSADEGETAMGNEAPEVAGETVETEPSQTRWQTLRSRFSRPAAEPTPEPDRSPADPAPVAPQTEVPQLLEIPEAESEPLAPESEADELAPPDRPAVSREQPLI